MTAKLYAFPPDRRIGEVDRHARVMRGMSHQNAAMYLHRVLESLRTNLEAIGIACDDADDILLEFAQSIGKSLHGSHFRLLVEG